MMGLIIVLLVAWRGGPKLVQIYIGTLRPENCWIKDLRVIG